MHPHFPSPFLAPWEGWNCRSCRVAKCTVHHEKQVYVAPGTTCKSERKEGLLAKSWSQRTGKGERSLRVNTRSLIMGKNEHRCEADHRLLSSEWPPRPPAHPAWRKPVPAKPHLSSSPSASEIVRKWKPLPNYKAIRRKGTRIAYLPVSFSEALFAFHCSHRRKKKSRNLLSWGLGNCWLNVIQ